VIQIIDLNVSRKRVSYKSVSHNRPYIRTIRTTGMEPSHVWRVLRLLMAVMFQVQVFCVVLW